MRDTYVLIVGSGFAGLGMAIRLKQAGIDDFVVLEQASDIGGTWRDNHYPGAACDVQSHLYSFSFEPWPEWSREFAPQKEILAYLEHCADKYGIRPRIRFGARVTRARWNEDESVWEVDTSDGGTIRARVLVPGCGPLSRPVMPDIPGLASFQGKTFHSARWDHSFPLEGKTVAVVGTGASAIQIVPAIAPQVGKLFVYQRTPAWVMPKPDGEIAAWKRAAFRRLRVAQRLARHRIYWTRELMALGFVVEPRIMKLGERFGKRYLQKKVADPVLRDRLTPRYTMGCKRVLPTNDYLPALQRPNVELVTSPIAEVRAHAIATKDGIERPVDAIVLATGFEAAEQVAPFEIRGRAGHELNEVWADGAEAYLGTSVSGFPNLFMLIGPNTGLGHTSMIVMIEAQVAYVLDAVKRMRARGLASVEVRPDAQAVYNAEMQRRLANTVWASGCMSWYLTRTGKNTTLWPGFTVEFRWRTRRFDASAYDEQTLSPTEAPTRRRSPPRPSPSPSPAAPPRPAAPASPR
ncbi:MAG TPA: NAD(P)/FAD-dependent oxidoreductase [Polyangiaceae bacterium]